MDKALVRGSRDSGQGFRRQVWIGKLGFFWDDWRRFAQCSVPELYGGFGLGTGLGRGGGRVGGVIHVGVVQDRGRIVCVKCTVRGVQHVVVNGYECDFFFDWARSVAFPQG